MKRQLDRLKGKRLVTGDPNLMTKDEICINATPNGVEVKEIGTDGKIKELSGGSGGSSEDNYEYYILGRDVPEDYPSLVSYLTDRASAYNYGIVGYSLYINAPLLSIFSDMNLSPEYIIISFKKHSHIEIHTGKQNIIKDSIDVYDYLVLVFAALGQSIPREEIKQIFPLIQSSKEEYYNIVDLDLPKNYNKILEERGYIE